MGEQRDLLFFNVARLAVEGSAMDARDAGLDRGRYVARAHLCAALTRTVADSFLPLRRVDAVAAISSRFIPRQYFSLFASPLTPWAGAPTRGSSLPLARPRPFASS